MKISQSTFPTPLYANLIVNYTNNDLRKLKTIEDVKETSLAVNIYFEELTSTEIEEQEDMSFEKLVSEIGGNLGFEFILLIIIIYFKHFFKTFFLLDCLLELAC